MTRTSIKDLALAALARREHSRVELARKLAAKGFAQESIEPVLDELEIAGYLDQQRFVESYLRSHAGRGPLRARAELRQHGVDAEQASECLDLGEYHWVTQACLAREKKFGPLPPHDAKEKAKQIRFLQYRGFSLEQIRLALARAGGSCEE